MQVKLSPVADGDVDYYKTCQIVPAIAQNTQKAQLAPAQNQQVTYFQCGD
jgi:hypothetical protein